MPHRDDPDRLSLDEVEPIRVDDDLAAGVVGKLGDVVAELGEAFQALDRAQDSIAEALGCVGIPL